LANNNELEDFVRSVCVSIQKGVTEGLELKFPVEFEVAVVIQKGTNKELKVLLVDASGNYAKQKISRIKFKIGTPLEAFSGKIRFFRK